jgi:hypothetical protein
MPSCGKSAKQNTQHVQLLFNSFERLKVKREKITERKEKKKNGEKNFRKSPSNARDVPKTPNETFAPSLNLCPPLQTRRKQRDVFISRGSTSLLTTVFSFRTIRSSKYSKTRLEKKKGGRGTFANWVKEK